VDLSIWLFSRIDSRLPTNVLNRPIDSRPKWIRARRHARGGIPTSESREVGLKLFPGGLKSGLDRSDVSRVFNATEEYEMDNKTNEGSAKRAKAGVEAAFGLPPGDKTPHGKGKPARDPNVPHGSLTASDAVDVPVPKGTGSNAK